MRVRIAPSPTGFFHVGNLRTALFNWLLARQTGGAFVVRVEDTDRARWVDGALEDMYASLDWLGLVEDESPRRGGPFAPYQQSERLDTYRRHVEQLLEGGHAYRCYCSPERLAEVREQRAKAGLKMGYDRHCRNLSAEEVAAVDEEGMPSIVRLKAPLAGELVMEDVLRGTIRFPAAEMEDAVLLKSDGFPTYHLAVVVDDHLMAITHVLRADEWIPSAPIQIALYSALGWRQPTWVHVPLVLNPGGKGKLSKRHTIDVHGKPLELMTQVREYRAAGYLPEAMFNYLALQGWSYGGDEEIFTAEQAIRAFQLEDIKSAPAEWNPEKLEWMNGMYIRSLPVDELSARLMPFLADAGIPASADQVKEVVPLIQERIATLADAPPLVGFLWSDVSPSPADLVPASLDAERVAGFLDGVAGALADLDPWEFAAIESALRSLAEAAGLKPRDAFQPVRVALTGSRVSPPLFESAQLLGRERCLERLGAASALLRVGAPA